MERPSEALTASSASASMAGVRTTCHARTQEQTDAHTSDGITRASVNTVEGCGRLWKAVEGCGRLWKAVGGILEGCGRLHRRGHVREVLISEVVRHQYDDVWRRAHTRAVGARGELTAAQLGHRWKAACRRGRAFNGLLLVMLVILLLPPLLRLLRLQRNLPAAAAIPE